MLKTTENIYISFMKYSQGIHIQISIKQYNENRNYHSQNSSKYRLIHGHFHIGLVNILRDINQANMEVPMYQAIYYILPEAKISHTRTFLLVQYRYCHICRSKITCPKIVEKLSYVY